MACCSVLASMTIALLFPVHRLPDRAPRCAADTSARLLPGTGCTAEAAQSRLPGQPPAGAVASHWEASVERVVRTADGRALAVRDAGEPGGRPVLGHLGAP